MSAPLTVRLQIATMLLHVLAGERYDQSKQRILLFMKAAGIFVITEADLPPYPSRKEQGSDEPRWATLVAFTRMELAQLGLMKEPLGRDRWRISTQGAEALERFKVKCASGVLDVRRGYLWTPKFKAILNPAYVQSDADSPRPPGDIYREHRIERLIARLLDEYKLLLGTE